MGKAIIGKKLGMTQLFDQESGIVTAVTVIEAGPCPVVQVRTPDVDGYSALQLAFGEIKERKLSKPEVGHLKHAGVAPHRHLVEFRDAEGFTVGETITVEAFEPGDAVKVSGRSKGKGFAGTIKRHNFASGPKSHGSHNVRKPGSIGASATPSRVFKGIRMAGHMGDRRVTQRGLKVAEVDAERNLLLIAGPGSRVDRRHRRSQDGRLMAALSAPTLGATTKAKLSGDVFGLERNDSLLHEVVKSELATRRQGTSDTKTRGRVAGGAAKPWRQKGTGRARQGTIRAPQWTGGGVVFGPHPRDYTGKINRKAHLKAIRIALSAHAADGTLAAIDGSALSEPRTKLAAELVSGWRSERPLVLVVAPGEDDLARAFRNLERTHVVEVGHVEAADLVWARSLIVSKSALAIFEGGEAS